MAALRQLNPALKPFFSEIKKFHLRPIKKISFQFDPFHENAKCVRYVHLFSLMFIYFSFVNLS